MNHIIYQKFLFYLSLLGVFLSIVAGFYDVIFEYVFEFTHLLFEVIEMALDRFVEETFHTEVHETQLIVFYILLAIGGIAIYLIWKLLAVVFATFMQGFSQDWYLLVETAASDWERLSIANKLFMVSLFLLFIYLSSFLLF